MVCADSFIFLPVFLSKAPCSFVPLALSLTRTVESSSSWKSELSNWRSGSCSEISRSFETKFDFTVFGSLPRFAFQTVNYHLSFCLFVVRTEFPTVLIGPLLLLFAYLFASFHWSFLLVAQFCHFPCDRAPDRLCVLFQSVDKIGRILRLRTPCQDLFLFSLGLQIAQYSVSKIQLPFSWLGILRISRPATPKNDRLTPVSIYFLLSHFERVLQNLTLFPHFAVLFLEFFLALFDFECILNSYLLLSIGHTDGLDLSPHGEFGATKYLRPYLTSHRDRDAHNEDPARSAMLTWNSNKNIKGWEDEECIMLRINWNVFYQRVFSQGSCGNWC